MPSIHTTELIDAPPDRVWQILADLSSYPDWNPFIIEASGELREGEKLVLRMQPPGGKAMNFRPTVLKADRGQELRWLGRLGFRGIFDGEHYFRLTPEGGGTRLDQGEEFTGLLPRFMGKVLSQTERGFEALNAALRKRAERDIEAPAGLAPEKETAGS